jgi:alkanesulfonate monooxygenase SsuD/methylene tetrahydromethanopterin reductase-like flavin-dependent oxidoreductase (luciferase family)
VRVGLVLPVFEPSPSKALDVARRAEDTGIDGVFSYDHLFPINRPDRPALAATAVLAAVAASTRRVRLGTLVSRVTLLPEPVLVAALATLDEIAGGRVIAGIGAGDSLTKPENRAYGLPFPPVSERLEALTRVARSLRSRGVRVWIGGRSPQVRELAAAEADGWNCWDGPFEELAAFSRRSGTGELTWGGPPPADGDVIGHLRALRQVGVAWVVYGPPPSTDWPRFVSELAGAAGAVS